MKDTANVNVWEKISINAIFSDNDNWELFKALHAKELRSVEVAEVEKMLSCQDGSRGFRVYQCPECSEIKVVHFGCNSRVCTHCGKRFADQWAEKIASKTFDVVHRHFTLTCPEELWSYFKQDRSLLKDYMDCAIKTISDVMLWKLGKKVLPGIVVVLHTYGADLKFYPHLHCLVTEGGFKNNGSWVSMDFFPYKALRKSWQYQLLTMMRKHIRNQPLIDYLFKKYSAGFYVNDSENSRNCSDRIKGKKELLCYLGRYVRHPAVAESRISGYDGKQVTFWFEDKAGVKHFVEMTVDEFISAITGHIPDKQFKTVRYYGAYSRTKRKKYKKLLGFQESVQKSILSYGSTWAPHCDNCDCKMKFIASSKEFADILGTIPPPNEPKFLEKITSWLKIWQTSEVVTK